MDHALIKRLRDERLDLINQQRSLLDAAEAEKRDLSAEENGGYEERDQRIVAIDERVKELADAEQRNRDSDAAFAALLAQPVEREQRSDQPSVADEFRSFARGEKGRHFDVKPDKAAGPVDFRALSKLSAGAGANTVKTSFYERLIAHLIEVSAILQAGPTVLNTATGETIQIPITTAHSSGALVAEAGTIATSEPTFGQRALGAYKYGALIQVSHELLNDTSVDLEGYLAMQAGRAVGNAFGAHLVTGTGSSQPSGIVTTATAGVTGGTGVVGVPTADNLIDLFYSVIAPYRNSPSTSWLMRDATVASIRKLKDSQGQYLWQPSLQLGAPDTFNGKPVRTDPNMAATGLGTVPVIFGDFSQYFVRMVEGLRFERSDDFAFNTDLVTFRVLIRGDGILVDQTGAVKKYTGGAS